MIFCTPFLLFYLFGKILQFNRQNFSIFSFYNLIWIKIVHKIWILNVLLEILWYSEWWIVWVFRISFNFGAQWKLFVYNILEKLCYLAWMVQMICHKSYLVLVGCYDDKKATQTGNFKWFKGSYYLGNPPIIGIRHFWSSTNTVFN